jgi:hypothetical protein
MKNFQIKGVEKFKTNILFSITFLKILFRLWDMWKSILERARPRMTIWHMRIACRITKATNPHSKYVILIAFPLQQWMHERASMLRYTYIAVRFRINFTFSRGKSSLVLIGQRTLQTRYTEHLFLIASATYIYTLCCYYRTRSLY